MTDRTHVPRYGYRGRRLLDGYHLPVAAFLLYYGIDTLATRQGPAALERAIPDWLTWAWALALIVGAVLVFYGVAVARTRAESSGHALHLFGIALYVAANAATLDQGSVASVLVFAGVALMRMGVLARSRRARREAGHILRGDR